MTRWKQLVLTCLIPAAGIALACEDDKPKREPKPADSAEGGLPRGVDPDLAQAVEAAGKKSAKPAGSADNGEGPPQTGVFAPGRADKELARGAEPKIALGDAGKEPRVALTSTVEPGWKQSGNIALTLKLGRGALPEISVDLAIEAVKPKAPAAPGAAPSTGAPAAPPKPAAPAPPSDGTPMLARITNIKVLTDVGAPGKDLGSVLARMKGSRIDYRLTKGGIGVDFSYTLAKGAEQELDMILRAITEALDTLTLGYPSEPVGEGGYWLITTRGNVSGTEVVSYRLVKLEKMAGDDLSLTVGTKRYAVSSKIQLAGLPPGSELDQFQSTADGKISAVKGSPIAKSGSAKQTFQAALIPAGGQAQPDQRLGVQSASDVTFEFGNAAKAPAAAKPPVPGK